jgi:hypothetical protein
LHTNAKSDRELLAVWIKSHRDGSPHTVRIYALIERDTGHVQVFVCEAALKSGIGNLGPGVQ